MKGKGALDDCSFSHVQSSLRSQQGQIYFGTLSGNSVDSVLVMMPSVETLDKSRFSSPCRILPV